MTQKPSTALDFIDALAALSHPSEELLDDFVTGKIDTDERYRAISEHIAKCSHCRELANMFGPFGLPESNTKH
jgi:hypothetical protein